MALQHHEPHFFFFFFLELEGIITYCRWLMQPLPISVNLLEYL